MKWWFKLFERGNAFGWDYKWSKVRNSGHVMEWCYTDLLVYWEECYAFIEDPVVSGDLRMCLWWNSKAEVLLLCHALIYSKIALRQQVEYRSTRCIRRGHCLWDERSNDVSYTYMICGDQYLFNLWLTLKCVWSQSGESLIELMFENVMFWNVYDMDEVAVGS